MTQSASKANLQVVQYTDKSIVVFGDSKPYLDRFKELKGRFNKNLKGQPGWIFANAKREAVISLVSELTGTDVEIEDMTPKKITVVKPEPSIPQRLEFPNVFTSSDKLQYQIVVYAVPLPSLNQKVTLEDSEFVVTALGSTRPPFDTITLTDVSDRNITHEAYLVGGKWRLDDFSDDELQFHPM